MSSIKSRVIVGLSLIILFFVAQAALVWSSKDQLHRDVVEVTRRNTSAAATLGDLAVLAQQIRRYEKAYFVYVGNPIRRNEYAKEWTQTHEKIAAAIASVRGNKTGAFSSADIAKASEWLAASEFYGQQMRGIFAGVEARASLLAPPVPVVAVAPAPAVAATSQPGMFTPPEVNEMIKDGKDRLASGLIKGVSQMEEEKSREMLALGDIADKGLARLIDGVLLTVAVGIVLAMLLIFILPAAVTSPVAALSSAVDAMSRGQLDTPIGGSKVHEFDVLEKSLERMRLAQQTMVKRLRLKNQ